MFHNTRVYAVRIMQDGHKKYYVDTNIYRMTALYSIIPKKHPKRLMFFWKLIPPVSTSSSSRT